MPDRPLIPIILCGGSGTRLWPMSRQSFPKQFHTLIKNEQLTLLQRTHSRINGLSNIKEPILICNEEHRFIVAEQMREIDIKPYQIILEPFKRNTASAIAIAALKALNKFDDPNLLILSSDHEIKNEEKFNEIVKIGLDYANKGRIVTFGSMPNSPETGYGYIEAENELNQMNIKGENITKFLEKPNKQTAKKLIKDKRYAWNSGIFLFNANLIISEINNFHPQIIKYCRKALNKNLIDLDFQRLDVESFKKCPNISIDIAVMEKTKLGTVLPLDAGWSDIGSWDSLWNISPKDNNGNVLNGKVLINDTKNSYLKSEERLIVGLGIKDLIVIETDDAILVANKNKSQNIKEIVQNLEKDNDPVAKEHKKIYRPWGHYISIKENSEWKVKMIFVKPKAKLSLQRHKYRSEHWIIVEGDAIVQLEHKMISLSKNQSTYIPKGSKHRIINDGHKPLVLIEVQTGSYLGEDDIERFQDAYGRIL